MRDDDGLQVDLLATIHGVRSFAGLRDRATTMEIGGSPLLVASLTDIIRSKPPLKKPPSRRARLAAVGRESERVLVDLIRRWQALPPERRTHFLRKRVAPGRSAL